MSEKIKVPMKAYKVMEADYKKAATKAEKALEAAKAKKAALDAVEPSTSAAPPAAST